MASRFITQARLIRPLGTALLGGNGVVRPTADCVGGYLRVSAAPSARHLHATSASLGFADRLTGAFTRGAEEKQEQGVFDAQLKFLLDRSRVMTGDTYLLFLGEMRNASGMGGFKEHLPWVANNPGLQDFKDREAILTAMTPAERADLSLVKISSKRRISKAVGQPVDAVEAMLDQVEVMGSVGQWLQKRQDAGLDLPKTTAEMRSMLAAPGSGLKRKRRKGRGRMQNPGLGRMAKRR